MTAARGPLLVTGLPRSGTSWVGKMLAASGELVYINEPLNPSHPPGRSRGVLNADVTHQFQYICDDNDGPWQRAFGDTLRLRFHPLAEFRQNRGRRDIVRAGRNMASFLAGRARERRPLLDDPYALFSTRWLVERFGATAVVLVREPVSFVASWERLRWTVYFDQLLEQQLLVRDQLRPDVGALRDLVGSADTVAKNATLWRAAYRVVDRWRDLSGVLIIRYEDLAADPQNAFRELYERCGLRWGDQAAATVRAATTSSRSTSRAFAWSVRGGFSRTAYRPMNSAASVLGRTNDLAEQDVGRVRHITADVAAAFYPRTAVSGQPVSAEER